MRLDKYCAQYWPEYSRSQWQKYIESGYVTVGGEVETSPKRLLGEDDAVKVDLPIAPSFDQTLEVIYQDDNVIVINKPSGILTHAKGNNSDEFSVAEFIRPLTTDAASSNRPGIVHRLDRGTSGVLIAARNSDAKRLLQKQFQDRKAKKTYYAIVQGRPKLGEADIDLPIERDPRQPSRFRIGPSGKPAQTYYKCLLTKDGFSLLELKPRTGRTHQLRVHLSYIGTPIAGDGWYGNASDSPIGRLALHAKSLEITIPGSPGSERKVFEAPLPEDFQAWINH